MTEQEAKIKDLELRVKKLEDKVFDVWFGQYDHLDPKTEAFYATMYPDVTTKPFDWNEVPGYFSVCKPQSGEYIGGPVAGYCPDYMKETK